MGRQQREANKTIEVVTSQLKAVAERVQDWSKIVIAYEPIWYGRTSSLEGTPCRDRMLRNV